MAGYWRELLNERVHPIAQRELLPKLIRTDESPTPGAFAGRIGERTHMPARFPYFRVHDDRAVEADHADFLAIRAGRGVADHVLPPGVLDVFLQLDAERAVVPEAVDAAVDFAGLKDKPAATAQRDQLFHVHGNPRNAKRS